MSTRLDKLECCFNALKEPLFVLSSDRAFVFGNSSFHDLIGCKGESSVKEFWPGIERHPILTGELTAELFNRNGTSVLVRLEGHSIENGFVLLRVISAQRTSDQTSLFHAQRLETLGLLAGAVAHDFNNVLTGIFGHATYLKTILPQSGPHIESLVAIEDGIKKGSSITAQVLSFSKLDATEVAQNISIPAVVHKTLNLLRKAIPSRIALETVFDTDLVTVLATEGQLAQVLVNLVMNARDAISEKGKITLQVSVECGASKLSDVFSGADLSANEYAVVQVADTGVGIESSIITKVFEPFFTTKRDKGTGLGLSTVHGIIKNLGGAVTIDSTIGEGTNVRLYLPSQTSFRTREAAQHDPKELLRGTERIMIVDDESPVRNVLSVSLQHLGYKTDPYCSALEALHHIDRYGLSADLVITDMLMPGMSGDEFFLALVKRYPGVKVLVISGFSAQGAVESMLTSGAKGFLPKPFTIEELAQTVRTILDSER